ncbi:MAG: WD40 repeat domain-containing protein [Pirellulaceae bacterium]
MRSPLRGAFALRVALACLTVSLAGSVSVRGQEKADDSPPVTVLEIGAPEGARLFVDGRDYESSRKLTFKNLDPEKQYTSTIRVQLPDGALAQRRVSFQAGDQLAWTWDEILASEDAVFWHPMLATRSATAAISPDGRRIVLPVDDKTAALFDAESGEMLHRYQAHEQPLRGVAFSPDGRQVATCGEDNIVQLFDVDEEKPTRRIVPPEHPRRAQTVVARRRPFRPFESLGDAIGSGIGDALDEALVEPLRRRYSHVLSVAFSPDGKQLLSSQFDGSVRLWDVRTGRQLRQFCGPRSAYSNETLPVISSAAFSQDGRYVTAADEQGWVRVWQTSNGRQTARLRADGFRAQSAQFSPDGRLLLTVGADKVARLWDAKSGEHLHLMYPRESAGIRVACFSGDGQVMTLGEDTAVRFWDADTGEETRRLPVGPSLVSKKLLIADPSGKVLLTDGLLGYQSRKVESGALVRVYRPAGE